MEKTIEQEILDYLKSGRGLTKLEAVTLFNTTSLNSRISDLRQAGNNIIGVPEKRGKKHFVRYWLSEEPLPTEQEEMLIENHLAQETPINLKEVNKQLCFV